MIITVNISEDDKNIRNIQGVWKVHVKVLGRLCRHFQKLFLIVTKN